MKKYKSIKCKLGVSYSFKKIVTEYYSNLIYEIALLQFYNVKVFYNNTEDLNL